MILRQSSAMKKINACVKKAHASLFSFINLPSLKSKDYIAVEAVNQHPKDREFEHPKLTHYSANY